MLAASLQHACLTMQLPCIAFNPSQAKQDGNGSFVKIVVLGFIPSHHMLEAGGMAVNKRLWAAQHCTGHPRPAADAALLQPSQLRQCSVWAPVCPAQHCASHFPSCTISCLCCSLCGGRLRQPWSRDRCHQHASELLRFESATLMSAVGSLPRFHSCGSMA